MNWCTYGRYKGNLDYNIVIGRDPTTPKQIMTNTFNLTDNERKLAEAADICFLDFTEPNIGYGNVDGDPARCCFTLKEAMAEGFTKHQVAGIIGSLEAKGVIWIDHRDGEHPSYPWLYWLTEDFIEYLVVQNKKAEKV